MTRAEDLDRRPTALVVVESMFGNTEQVGRAVAPVDLPAGLDLVVVGAPTHAFSLSRRSTRADAVRQGARAERAATGLREWLSTVLPQDPRQCPVAAVFDTRVSKVRRLPAAAGPRALRMAKRRGLTVLGRPEAFLVADIRGPLVDGELERATAWGHDLAGELERRISPRAHST